MANEFSVTSNSVSMTDKNGRTFTVSDVTKDEAHKLLSELEKVWGRPQEITQEEVLAPERVSFLEDSDGGLKGNN